MNRVVRRNAAGFSLLELMVVVAIIGVLAAVAVPRFNIFRARARQAEAKSNLGVIFTLQEAFKIDKEKYYNGNADTWGGTHMRDSTGAGNFVGYSSGGNTSCGANKLGFRLANCSATRYRYWVEAADEHSFLVGSWAKSDANARVFPGCAGNQTGFTKPSDSKSGSKKCQSTTVTAAGARTDADFATAILAAAQAGGDAFCLDHYRTVDNFRDIVGDPLCTD